VLARYFAVDGAPEAGATQSALWALAERCTPLAGVAAYTQAIMDLGATVCTRSKPRCEACPLNAGCRARQESRQQQLPARRARRVRPQRSVCMLIAERDDGTVLLERRPPRGIWGGLWSLPEFSDADSAQQYCRAHLLRAAAAHPGTPRQHAFTHFDLAITPLRVRCEGHAGVMDARPMLWYNTATPSRVGLPAPVQQLIDEPHR
jgi:A/G-specific adenine glycosylase